MKKLKHIINWTVWTLIGLYALLLFFVQLPAVQHFLGQQVALALKQKLGTDVSIGSINIGFLNRIIIDDITILDKQQKEMLRANRLTAKVEMAPLTRGKIAISSAQIFGVNAHLYRQHAQAPANFQFVLDSLASKDTTSHTPLDLRINSFIMRHSSVTYDQWDKAPTTGRFNPCHVSVSEISAHVHLKCLTDDSLNIRVKRLAFKEQSGLDVRHLAFEMTANKGTAHITDFAIELPATNIRSKEVTVHLSDSSFHGTITNSAITPSDLAVFYPPLRKYSQIISFDSHFSGTGKSITIERIKADADNGDLSILAKGRYSQTMGSGAADNSQGIAAISNESKHDAMNSSAEWEAEVDRLKMRKDIIDFIGENITAMPAFISRLGNISVSGHFEGNSSGALVADASITTDVGTVDATGTLSESKHFEAHFKTDGVEIGKILDNATFGLVGADLSVAGQHSDSRIIGLSASGTITNFGYEGYNYRNITLEGSYIDHFLKGWLNIDDERIKSSIEADIHATSLKDATGVVSIKGLRMPEKDFELDFLRMESGYKDGQHHILLNSDFAHAEVHGKFDYSTLSQSVANIMGAMLPTLPGLPRLTHDTNNNFSLNLTVTNTEWLKKFFGIPLSLKAPVNITGAVNDGNNLLSIDADIPSFSYNGNDYEEAHLNVRTPDDTLRLSAHLNKLSENGGGIGVQLTAKAADNNINTSISWGNYGTQKPFSGQIEALAHLYNNFDGQPEAHVTIVPSPVHIGSDTWHVEASDMLYSPKRLYVDQFTVKKDDQYMRINGHATDKASDSLTVELKDVEVAYIMQLIDFHSVEFSGEATGTVRLSSVFDNPSMHADLSVNHFNFEDGRMGVLSAAVDWNRQLKQIDIDATANDGPDAMTYISGYVSPERNYIDLDIRGRGTHIDFLQTYTGSFLSNVGGHARGDVRLSGPLGEMQLTGMLVVDGQATVKPLGTTYSLRNDTVRFVTDDILLENVPIYDKYDNVAILSGGIHHRHLTRLTFDLGVQTDLLLGYDFKDFGENTFYGTVFAAGDVALRGRPGQVSIDCDITPLQGSVFTYNVASPDGISNQEFISWRSKTTSTSSGDDKKNTPEASVSTDIYLNFNIYVSPDATMRLLMDATTGDYITLNGSGVLRATYYNKGVFQMFGTYAVDYGTYGITIQNIIKKNFTFNQGGTIVFGGDPYDAAIQLQAVYPVQGVSLSDLNIGNSFSQNTIRVNCLMNIGGQPNSPRVDFDLDMPTVNADEQQMVRSLINGDQEMNQQVLYLLSIGRFYQQGQNNEQSSQDQTSLAMQSLLSGTLSSQLNNVLSSVIKNDDWNFGANISTGTEGWNNAEYEGIVNGRMLNNRLIINGQFGYRDNATQATPSFIGDFDIRYLLQPNGNLALKVYNQTNDRYFTRSSLNTQGVGLIMKKDFGRLTDLFRKRQ